MDFQGRSDIEEALRRVGELLAAEGHEYAIVVLGGAALDLLEIVNRKTRDVDILAFAKPRSGRAPSADSVAEPPEPMPEPLQRAARIVARDLELDQDWLNTDPSLQWRADLPPEFATRIRWSQYGGALWVGLVDRYDHVFFKLFAAADLGRNSRHYQDLLALHPSAQELSDASAWVETQDASSVFPAILKEILDHARRDLGFD